jgi:hypothetical protein
LECPTYGGSAIKSGAKLYANEADGGKVGTTQKNSGVQVAWCMKGVTAAKEAKNVAGTTLCPIRVKLLV